MHGAPAPMKLISRYLGEMIVLGTIALVSSTPGSAQFIDHFDGDELQGWSYNTGDGLATIDMVPNNGRVTILVDATQDRDNIWWALVRRDVSSALDLGRLQDPHHELRIEARVRPSHAPRRVNLHLNTQRTVDFHSHLMEFDLPDTSWHTISMTTREFDARPGDTVNGQLALIDWGLSRYRVDVEYFRVDVVDTTKVGPDAGEQVPYHPPVPALHTFDHHVPVRENAMIDLLHPDVPLHGWIASGFSGEERVLTVDGTRYVILRWDLDAFAGLNARKAGLLTLFTHSVQRVETHVEEYGRIRITEVLGGDPDWNQETVTLNRFTGGIPFDEVVNSQMIIDVEPAAAPGDTTFATISRPVLQRLIDGRTKGLLIRPLGPVSASFYSTETAAGAGAPALHFSTEP